MRSKRTVGRYIHGFTLYQLFLYVIILCDIGVKVAFIHFQCTKKSEGDKTNGNKFDEKVIKLP